MNRWHIFNQPRRYKYYTEYKFKTTCTKVNSEYLYAILYTMDIQVYMFYTILHVEKSAAAGVLISNNDIGLNERREEGLWKKGIFVGGSCRSGNSECGSSVVLCSLIVHAGSIIVLNDFPKKRRLTNGHYIYICISYIYIFIFERTYICIVCVCVFLYFYYYLLRFRRVLVTRIAGKNWTHYYFWKWLFIS